jgi:hypothetical protein
MDIARRRRACGAISTAARPRYYPVTYVRGVCGLYAVLARVVPSILIQLTRIAHHTIMDVSSAHECVAG